MSKPQNWDSMSVDEKLVLAEQLADSHRGKFLISKALMIAIKRVKRTEPSTAEDMEILILKYPVAAIFDMMNKNLNRDRARVKGGEKHARN